MDNRFVDNVLALSREQISWAVVTQADPMRVKFPGDRHDVPVGLAMKHYTAVLNDRVVLLEVAPAQWVCLGSYE